ncbi:MAG TPA: hypothetical protein LFV92_00690 [Rickettsia endosymbiont of Ceroptres masudai]|nr:hypothetical protein [Rickettsia endosymbiont of Ceroptres masudai]
MQAGISVVVLLALCHSSNGGKALLHGYPRIVIARSEATWQSRKIIKKIL